VTGAAQGIGLAIARRLVESGANVMLADVNAVKVKSAASALGFGAQRVASCAVDVASSAQTRDLVAATLDTFGSVHILVNNAGGSGQVPIAQIEDITDEVWDSVVNANLRGTFYCCRAVAPVMKANRYGRIINLSSVVARGFGGPLGTVGARIPYAAAKSGVEGLTRQLSKDLAPFGITVNAIVPGLVMTEPGARMFERFALMESDTQAAIRAAFNQNLATGEDVAQMVAYLAAEGAAHVSGQEIAIGNVA
jgi:3-oxoacyl-[acyl-carrier protein] reductase